MAASPYVSVVIPVRNEQDNVTELVRSLQAVLDFPYEIIFVDDGSTDGTWERLLALHAPGRIRLVRLRRDFGKTAALSAGFSLVQGEVVVTMDGDLQDDPREVPRFLQKLDEGYDLVVGWKQRRRDPRHKVAASRIFNFAVAKVTGLGLHDVNCGFKAFRADTVRAIHLYGDMHRFIPVLAAAQGFRVAEIDVTHHARKHGRSKYGFERLYKGFFDLITVVLITRFGERPSHGFGFAALVFVAAGAALAISYAWSGHFWPYAFLAIVLLIGSLIFFAAGWVAEIVVARRGLADPLPSFRIEEQFD